MLFIGIYVNFHIYTLFFVFFFFPTVFFKPHIRFKVGLRAKKKKKCVVPFLLRYIFRILTQKIKFKLIFTFFFRLSGLSFITVIPVLVFHTPDALERALLRFLDLNTTYINQILHTEQYYQLLDVIIDILVCGWVVAPNLPEFIIIAGIASTTPEDLVYHIDEDLFQSNCDEDDWNFIYKRIEINL
jgi:hypothetical protein